MKIAYGIHGYGRGHATRAHGVLPFLSGHDLTIIAGGDAHHLLSSAGFTVERIPTMTYEYRSGETKYSRSRTFAANAGHFADLFLHGPTFRRVVSILKERRIDLVISDSEPWTQRAANVLGIPLVSIDHYAIFAYCALQLTRMEILQKFLTSVVYRFYMGTPHTIVASAFFGARPKKRNVRVVGPIVRPVIKNARPVRGEHLLVYFNKAEQFLNNETEAMFERLGCEIRIYGKGALPRKGPLIYRAIDPVQFVDDLASCRAVVSSAGNQLVGETIWLQKPILVIPEHSVDQRLNAREIVRLNVGMQTTVREFTAGCLRDFFAREDFFRAQCALHARDATSEVVGIIDEFGKRFGKAGDANPRVTIA